MNFKNRILFRALLFAFFFAQSFAIPAQTPKDGIPNFQVEVLQDSAIYYSLPSPRIHHYIGSFLCEDGKEYLEMFPHVYQQTSVEAYDDTLKFHIESNTPLLFTVYNPDTAIIMQEIEFRHIVPYQRAYMDSAGYYDVNTHYENNVYFTFPINSTTTGRFTVLVHNQYFVIRKIIFRLSTGD